MACRFESDHEHQDRQYICYGVSHVLNAQGAETPHNYASVCKIGKAACLKLKCLRVRFSPLVPYNARVRKLGKAVSLKMKCLRVQFSPRVPKLTNCCCGLCGQSASLKN